MIIDLNKTAKQTGIDDHETLKMLIGEYFNVCQADIDKLPQAISQKDFSAVQSLAHNIKGAARNLWLEEIGNDAQVLETLGKTAVPEGMAEAYQKLLKTYNQGKAEFAALG